LFIFKPAHLHHQSSIICALQLKLYPISESAIFVMASFGTAAIAQLQDQLAQANRQISNLKEEASFYKACLMHNVCAPNKDSSCH
jgi:hypothetical protein